MKFEFSAGGVVFKKQDGQTLILVAQHSGHHGWVFPKGLIDKDEKKEDTAVREVKEETGIEGKIIAPLKPMSFWYQWEGEKKKKTVYYFVMEAIGGDISNHDFEMEKVEWIPKDEVEKRLTYDSEKKVWEEAQTLILS